MGTYGIKKKCDGFKVMVFWIISVFEIKTQRIGTEKFYAAKLVHIKISYVTLTLSVDKIWMNL